MRNTLLGIGMLAMLGTVEAQESTLYRGFAELRSPQTLAQNQWVWEPGRALFDSLVPGTLRLIGVTEQSRQVSQMAAANPLAVYVGKTLQFFWEGQWRNATLVSLEPLVYQYEGRYLTSLPGVVAYPNPDGFKAQPGPKVTFKYQGAGPATLAFLTRGISWDLRYSLEVSPGAQNVELVGWATLSNTLGSKVELGKTELVAGSVPLMEGGMNVPIAMPQVQMRMQAAPAADSMEGAQYAGEASGTYRYKLPSAVSLEPGLTELPFIRSKVNPVYTWRYEGGFNTGRELNFIRGYRFAAPENMAAGNVSIRDQGLFVGQAGLGDTAKGNDVKLSLGPDPDGKATRQVEQQAKNKYKVTTVVRNSKSYPVETEIFEYLPQPFTLEFDGAEKLPEGYRIRFTLKPGESRTLSYTVTFPQQR